MNRIIFASFLLISLISASTIARDRESVVGHLLSPGPMIESHKNFADNCLKCHGSGEGIANDKCLACHKNIKADVIRKQGFHGKAADTSCTECHKDHKGRSFDSTAFNIQNFDHNSTGYTLDGKHVEVKCFQCHTKTREKRGVRPQDPVYFGLSTSCVACHKKQDVHAFKDEWAKKDCNQCHVTSSWTKDIHFSHSQETHFELLGQHSHLNCAECHVTYKKNLNCAQCHGGKVFDPKIVIPHRTSKYKFAELDEKGCVSCHADYHAGQLPQKCEQCHGLDSWKLKNFDHDKSSSFKLVGKHASVTCGECHKPMANKTVTFAKTQMPLVRYKPIGSQCLNCHTDYHSGQLPQKCDQCHGLDSWKLKNFDHDKSSSFKLIGKHATTACSQCHLPIANKTVTFAKTQMPVVLYKPIGAQCLSCHADYHAGQLPQKCDQCHGLDSWKLKNFDHDKSSSFKLNGKHASVACGECHKPMVNKTVTFAKTQMPVVQYKPMGSNCVDCHKDPHKPSLGTTCTKCHNEKTWRSNQEFHKNFTLSGVHYNLECTECHINNRLLSGMSNVCIACHNKDDIHGGTLPNCGDCHRQEFWEVAKFKHSLSRFPLRGIHRTLDCSSCHQRSIYQGTPSRCVDCHLRDATGVSAHPVPLPAFQSCNQCHNQFTFH